MARDQSVVEAEDRHEEEALELEVDAEDSGGCRGESRQDHVHAVGHDRADGHHEDGRYTDDVDTADRVTVGTKDPAPAQVDVGVELQVHDKAEDGGYALAQDRCVSGARDAESRTSEETEDHDRVEDNVDDSAGGLADHAQLSAAGGLQESLKGHLEEETDGEAGHGREVSVAVFDDLSRGCGV